MTLNEKLAKLSLLAEIDIQIYNAKEKLQKLDDGTKAKEIFAKLIALENANNAKLNELSSQQKAIEDNIATLTAKKDKAHNLLYSGNITNPKELKDLQAEEQSLIKRISDLDLPMLEIMEKVEAAKKRAEEIAAKSLEVKKEYQKIVNAFKTNTQLLTDKINELSVIREERKDGVGDEMLLNRYDGIRKKGNGIGMSVIGINDTLCAVCKTAISQNTLSKLKDGTELCFCENCGRILYQDSDK